MPEVDSDIESVYISSDSIHHFADDFSNAIHTIRPIVNWNIPAHQESQYKYIKSYDYIPKQFNFNKLDNEEELYMGVELEIDKGGKKDDNAKLVVDLLGSKNAYCKHDGSLSESGSGGFEIVTHPCTYEYHQQLPYEILFKQLSELGYRSHDTATCGLHVHINRDYFAKDKLTQDLCISKLLYLFEKFWDKIVIIARRDSNSYAKRFYLKDNETILDLYAKSKNSNKYGVINLNHKNTVEIRIFKGTLNYCTFIATLQFVKHIANITKEVDIYNIQELTWNDIETSFSSDLIGYINERGKIKGKERRFDNNTMAQGQPISYTDAYGRMLNSFANFAHVAEQESSTNIEDMTIQQIKNKINELKRLINRSRNPMERRCLQREMGRYSNRLGELRRRCG